ncbi:MAG: hypothetical protein ACOY71_00145 [Gemmatimonadota bacterium]
MTPLRVVADLPLVGEVRIAARAVAKVPGAVLWRDELGAPVLIREPVGAGARYHYLGRFAPSAGTLLESAAFPELMALLAAEAHGVRPGDAPVARRQALPGVEPALPRPPIGDTDRDLSLPVWFAVTALFAAERRLAARRRTA